MAIECVRRGNRAVQATSTWEAKPVRLPVSPMFTLYVVAPLVLLALPLALFRVTVGPEASLVLSLYFWSATVMVGWLAAALGSAVIFRVFARFRPPLWVILFCGPVLSGLVLREPIVEILSLANMFHVSLPRTPPAPMTFTWAFWGKFVQSLAPGTIIWVTVNYVFDRMLDIPRYRYPQEPAPVTSPPATAELPPLIERLPHAERGGLVALRAEDHYVRIYTDIGVSLTLARLRDAIEMAQPVSGMQVHRSNWVADRAVRGFRRTGHTGILYLSNGLEMPVSRSYCSRVERRAKSLFHEHASGDAAIAAHRQPNGAA